MNYRNRNASQHAKRFEPLFSIVEPCIFKGVGHPFEHARCIDEVKAMIFDVDRALALRPCERPDPQCSYMQQLRKRGSRSRRPDGSVPISNVLAPGQKLEAKGLTYAATPAGDVICGTLQLAAGMNLHVFITGRGTPYGLAAVPVIKVATRSPAVLRDAGQAGQLPGGGQRDAGVSGGQPAGGVAAVPAQ